MKEKMNKIPVFYACDDNFVKYTMVSLQSMMDHASKEAQYEIHVLHTNISEEMQKKMHAMENANFSVQFDHVTEYLHSVQEKLPLRDYYSKTTYFRLFIAEMFPEIDKAIYIDSDTVVLGDIAQLYAYDLGDAYVGACREQVMIQEDVYGTYVEKVLGVERDNYFNAGMLVINCEQFRKNHVLEQFMELLPMYNFVVTQDEDYLNLICHNKVCWLPQKWNVEVFGQIPCREEEICVLHYIMVSKPWHYSDCRLQEYFWESAQKTSVYAEIRKVLESYTDEERKRDAESCDRLMQTAKDEIAKENNYLNLVKAGKLKSKDRLEVLEKIALYEREGRFGEDVEEDPPTRQLQPSEIDYLRKKLKSRIKTNLTYKVARSFLNKIIENKQLIIKDVIGTEHMDALTSGAVITCNHFNAFDSFAMQIAYEKSKQCKKRRLYRVIRDYGEDKFAKNIAKHIVAARGRAAIETTGQLTQIIRESIPMKYQKMSGHPAKRTFQAIRIELNRELDVLRDSLDDMIDLLKPGGRLCIITFHSLEDRIVKSAFRKNENPCTCPPDFPVCVCGKVSKGKVITKKPILPSKEEQEYNSRSKSAKLRIFERA